MNDLEVWIQGFITSYVGDLNKKDKKKKTRREKGGEEGDREDSRRGLVD